MPRIDIAGFTSGVLIALLTSSLALAGLGLYWVLPQYSQDVANTLLSEEPTVLLEKSVPLTVATDEKSSEVFVPAATIIGRSAVAADTQASSRYVRDKQNVIELRVPSDSIVEHLSDGFLLKNASAENHNEVQVVISGAAEGDAKSTLASISGVPEEQIATVEGQSRGFLAQASQGSQALFKNANKQVLLTVTTSNTDFLTQFQAIIRTLRFL
jgi:hypothetical protein